MKNVGVPFTPLFTPLMKSSRTRAAYVPASRSPRIRSASRPTSVAYSSRWPSSRANWRSKRRSCICQKAPCAPAASAASAACSASGWILVRGKLRNTNRSSEPSARCTSLTIGYALPQCGHWKSPYSTNVSGASLGPDAWSRDPTEGVSCARSSRRLMRCSLWVELLESRENPVGARMRVRVIVSPWSGLLQKSEHLLDDTAVTDDPVMPQSHRRHELRARPRTGNRRAVVPAHFPVITVVNHQQRNLHCGRKSRDIHSPPFEAQAALRPLSHGCHHGISDPEQRRELDAVGIHVRRRCNEHRPACGKPTLDRERGYEAAERMTYDGTHGTDGCGDRERRAGEFRA